jgi:hypothetical protein
MEIIFRVIQEPSGGFVGECTSHDIFTEADDLNSLCANIQKVVNAYFFDQAKPTSIRLEQCGVPFKTLSQ